MATATDIRNRRIGPDIDSKAAMVEYGIRQFQARHGRGPTVDEIDYIGRRSELWVILTKLAQRGLIRHPGMGGGEIVAFDMGGEDGR